MVEVLHHLLRDHVHLRELLDLIEEQMSRYERGGDADIDLLRTIMEYTQSYPGTLHEPKEILIYKRLLQRCADAPLLIGDLLAEHGSLAELTRRLAADLQHAARFAAASRHGLAQLAADFVRAYRHHIELEELRFFTLALKHLLMSDWREIDAAVAAPDDPVFGERVQLPFAALRQQIRSLSGSRP